MPDEVGVFSRLEFFEDGFECVADGVKGARIHLLEQAFDLGEDLLDGIEIGAVGRQVK